MKKRIMLFIACLFSVVSVALAQNRITGTVIAEEDGLPVMGASILVKGTTIGTVTDMDGKYTLSGYPSSAKTLVVSYVGMKTQEVTLKNNLKIVLESDTEVLDEVMVVAFGQQKKSAFTGSAAVVNSESLSTHVTTNVTDALVGSVPGLQMRGGSGTPGSGSGDIYIRGIASMYADAKPLVIVDGAPYTASLSNIPQSDIESVTVLKDAASAALYGARGAAGVILVTTKKGNTSDARITLDMKWGQMSRAVQEYDKITDPGEYYEAQYAQHYNFQLYNKGLNPADANIAANKLMMQNLQYQLYTIPQGQQLVGMDGKLNPAATLGYTYTGTDGQQYYMTADDWVGEAYRKALRQEYTLSASGGNDKATFYTSLGYLNEDGILHHSNYERINGRLKADYQAKKWLKLGANVSYTNSKTISNPNAGTSSNETNPAYFTTYIAPIYPVYIRKIIDGQPQIALDQHGHLAYDYARTAADSYANVVRPFLSGNPLGANYYNKANTWGNQLNATFNATVNFTSFLKLDVNSNVVLGQTDKSNYDTMFYGPKVSVGGELTKSSTTAIRTNNSQTLTFFKDFGKHNISVLAGHEYYKTTTRYLEATARGLFSEDVLELNAAADKTTNKSYTTAYNVEGFFGSAQYNYDEKYFLSASYRRDATSRFYKDNKWGNFWSVGGAYIISKEKFMESTSSWLDQLKLKLSIGQQGNDNIGDWRYVDLYNLNASGDYSMSPSFYRKGNDAITWETTTNINLGLEFSLWRGRLNGTVDLYSKKVNNLLFSLNVPGSSGYSSYMGNVGSIKNQGVEITLSGSIIRSKNFDWNVSANASHNYTKIIDLPESKVKANGGFVTSASGMVASNQWFKIGGSFYNPFRYSYAGVSESGEAMYWVDSEIKHNTSKPGTTKDYTTTNPNEATYYEMGNTLPILAGGFSTTFRIKSVDVTLNFDYQIGGKIYDSQYATLMRPDSDGSNGYTIHKDWKKSWNPNNTSSNIPRWQYNDLYTATASDRFYQNAGYLNFQSFTVGYSLPKKLVRKMTMSNVRIYAAGENLIFWSARKGLDPRSSFSSGASMDVSPTTRNLTAGVQVTF